MNKTFSFSRLLQLIRKQWIENARSYVLATLALMGVLALVLLFWFHTSGYWFYEQSLYMIFTVGLYITGGVFASMAFSMLGDKQKGTYWLAFPASHFEKLLCIIFYNVVVFTLVYCACFLLLKTVAYTYITSNPLKYNWRSMDWENNRNGFSQAFPYFMYGFFAVQAFYMLGSVYFTRYTFVLTTIAGAMLIGAFIWTFYFCIQTMLPNGYNWEPNYVYQRNFKLGINTTNKYQLPDMLTGILSIILKFIWAPVFWITAWYRLREKQL